MLMKGETPGWRGLAVSAQLVKMRMLRGGMKRHEDRVLWAVATPTIAHAAHLREGCWTGSSAEKMNSPL